MVALCKIPGVRVHRQNSGKILIWDPKTKSVRAYVGAPEGAADISGILAPEGIRIEIETKSSKGKIRAAQEVWAEHIRKSGGLYVYAPLFAEKHVDESVSCYVAMLIALIHLRRNPIMLPQRNAGP